MSTRQTGEFGEIIAKKYLLSKNYNIVYQNWSSRWAELDFILYKDGVLIFLEVKYKNSISFGYPTEEINKRKLKCIKRSIYMYLAQNKLFDEMWRFDVISIYKKFNKYNLYHYRFVELPS